MGVRVDAERTAVGSPPTSRDFLLSLCGFNGQLPLTLQVAINLHLDEVLQSWIVDGKVVNKFVYQLRRVVLTSGFRRFEKTATATKDTQLPGGVMISFGIFASVWVRQGNNVETGFLGNPEKNAGSVEIILHGSFSVNSRGLKAVVPNVACWMV